MDDRHDQEGPSTAKSRRDFLKTAGKLAVYTPPVLLAMSRPGHALFMKSNGGKPVDGGHENHRPRYSHSRGHHHGWLHRIKGLL